MKSYICFIFIFTFAACNTTPIDTIKDDQIVPTIQFPQTAVQVPTTRIYRSELPKQISDTLATAEQYETAKYAQIYVGSGKFDDGISWIARSSLCESTNVPGGLEHVEGWQSALYKFLPEPPRVWVENIVLADGNNGIYAKMYKRSYADGTWFADVLSSERGVFEVRISEKVAGEWQYYVMWKNKYARPTGYEGLKQKCASCHLEAGTGIANQAMFPGGDEVLSDPLFVGR